MNTDIITEVLDKLIGKTEPIADSAVDKERLKNLETLIDVTTHCLERIFEVSRSDLLMYGSAEECIEKARSALYAFAEDIKNELS